MGAGDTERGTVWCDPVCLVDNFPWNIWRPRQSCSPRLHASTNTSSCSSIFSSSIPSPASSTCCSNPSIFWICRVSTSTSAPTRDPGQLQCRTLCPTILSWLLSVLSDWIQDIVREVCQTMSTRRILWGEFAFLEESSHYGPKFWKRSEFWTLGKIGLKKVKISP